MEGNVKIKDFSCTTHGEVNLKGGLIEFQCRPEDVEMVKNFLRENVRDIDIPHTREVNVEHGGYGRYSRFKIKKLDYAGGEGGYIEAIEILNPPERRCGFVIHEWNYTSGSTFLEFKTAADAKKSFEESIYSIFKDEKEIKADGFKRKVKCGEFAPWFYAVGNQALIGDYAVPEDMQDDPVYKLGKKFVVYEDDVPYVKTCMGSRFSKDDESRTIYWDDGSTDSARNSNLIRPLEENELWIVEAISQFKKLISGNSDRFTINFLNGSKFHGNYIPRKKGRFSPEGDYFLQVKLKGGKVKEGWVHDFKPTEKYPDIIEYAIQGYKSQKKEVEHIKITDRRLKGPNKKWPGVFFKKEEKK